MRDDEDSTTGELFGDLPEGWRAHWDNMPAFEMDDLTPHRVINVRFRNDADVEAFAALLGQPITPKQKALWFPYAEPRRASHLRYVDESEISSLHSEQGAVGEPSHVEGA